MSQGELCAAPEKQFHLYALFPVPRPGFSPGKHRSHSNENSLLLLLSTDDSFLITFGVGSGKDFLKIYGSSFCRTLGFMQPLLCAGQYCVCIIRLKNSEVGIVSFQKLYGQGSWGGSAG